MAQLDQGVVESVINSNFKTIGEQVATNTSNTQARLQLIAESSVGQIVNRLNSLDPTEAQSISQVISSDMAKAVAQLGTALGGIQQFIKTAQTTPPVTP
jgi:hypothetical protein